MPGGRRALLASFAALALGFVSTSARQAPAPTAIDPRLTELAQESLSIIEGDRAVFKNGVAAPIEVIRDRWGVPHIYASNTRDLFRAQGYVTAQDRLWQMEMWRRGREGRMAEILGPQAVARDRTTRLLTYRGPIDDREWTSYHPEGRTIFEAFAEGVNAFIDEATRANRLPVEFRLTGIRPDRWTAETVVLRTASFGNASSELQLARNVARLGLDEANRRSDPDPFDALRVPDGLDVAAIDDAVVGAARGGRGGGRPEILDPSRWRLGGRGGGLGLDAEEAAAIPGPPGSNNWVVSGALSATGKPVVANDPHREVSNPSLRYIVHLNAPGWNVIGAGEPPFVGVAIGHNERVAWGLTIVGTDQEDVYVETLNPSNPNEVRWLNGWERLRVVREEIRVKGASAETVTLEFSRHGPIFYKDAARKIAYALRSAILEPGTAPYLAGLRLAQAPDCRQFLDAAMYWKAPTENLICGDVDGNISWQASALTPDRDKGRWSGRLPVPGDGRYEWTGFRTDLPRELNPARGFIATANNNVQPAGYAPPIMFKSAANVPFDRITRLLQLLQPGRKYTIDDHRAMQGDALHLRAKAELAWFRGWRASAPEAERARAMLDAWDAVLTRDSAAGAVYSTWRSLSTAEARDAARPLESRRLQIEATLARTVERLTSEQGADWSAWRWGRMHTRAFPHPLASAFNLPTVERPGGSGTVAADGASYREILDVSNWDHSMVTNTPGQSGQPGSPFYGSLLPLWADDVYFPLVYSRARVEQEGKARLVIR